MGIQTTRKSTTQETPFTLAFGAKAVVPIEVGLKSPRVEFANAEHNEEILRLNLDLLDEKCEQVLRRTEDYGRKQQNITTEGSGPGVLSLAT